MNRKWDVEDLLMRFRVEPAARVKRAAMARYSERYGRERRPTGAAGMWRRPVPVYLMAALVLLSSALSFVGGRSLSREREIPKGASAAAQDSLAEAALERSWQAAPRDVL